LGTLNLYSSGKKYCFQQLGELSFLRILAETFARLVRVEMAFSLCKFKNRNRLQELMFSLLHHKLHLTVCKLSFVSRRICRVVVKHRELWLL